MTYDENGRVVFDEREIIELTIRACLPNLTDGEVHVLRERVSHGIFNLRASRSRLSASHLTWGYDDDIRITPTQYDIVKDEVRESLHNINQMKVSTEKICDDFKNLKNLDDK